MTACWGGRKRVRWLCLLALLGLMGGVSCVMDGITQPETEGGHLMLSPVESSGVSGRQLLRGGAGSAVLASGADGVMQTAEDDSDEDASGPARALLGTKGKAGSGKRIVGVHIKQFKAPKGSGVKGQLLTDSKGKPLLVKTRVSPPFKKYLDSEEDFQKRVGYVGTIKRKELNTICKRVAKGHTKFKTDLNVDPANGDPNTGDDIVGAKVDHQFGCTASKGPKVELNPQLKAGVVFALLELGATSNLIDCPAGVKKCNMWELLDGKDAEELTELYAKRGKGRRGRRLWQNPFTASYWRNMGQQMKASVDSLVSFVVAKFPPN